MRQRGKLKSAGFLPGETEVGQWANANNNNGAVMDHIMADGETNYILRSRDTTEEKASRPAAVH